MLLLRLLILFFSALPASTIVLHPRDCTSTITPSWTATVTAWITSDLTIGPTSYMTVYSEASSLAWATSTAIASASATSAAYSTNASVLALLNRNLSPNPEGCSVTYLPISTTTVATSSITYTHHPIATTTAPACAAHNIFNGTVDYNSKQTFFGPGQPRGEVHPDLDPEACCNYCFRGSCLYFTWAGEGQCEIFWADGGCPNGVGGTEALRFEDGGGSWDGERLTGLGPCLIEVPFFRAG